MELFTLNVCPACNTEGMNQVFQQGEGVFLSICETCDTFSIVSIPDKRIPMQSLIEDFVITFMHLVFGIFEQISNRIKRLTSRKSSTSL